MFKEFDQYKSVRSMLEAIIQWKEPQTFFQRLFFKEIKEHSTQYVEVDFRDETRRVAPFIHREGTGQTYSKTQFEKFIYEPPYIKPRENIEPKDLREVLEGESIHSTNTPGQRFVELRNTILKRLDDSISRREELMAIQAVFDKEIKIVDEDANEIADRITFTRASELDFSASTVWSDVSNAKPLQDVRKARRLITKRSGMNGNIAVMGRDAADEFLEVTSVQNVLDNRRMEMGSIRMQAIAELESMGATWVGQVDGVDYFRYDVYYLDPITKTELEMIPPGKVAIGSTEARNVRHYGSIDTLEAASGSVKARRFPKFYDSKDQDPEVYGIQIHSAPLPVTHQPNAFAVITT